MVSDMSRVSGHSGLREEIELAQIERKYEQVKVKRQAQVDGIMEILKPMPITERKSVLAYVIQHIKGE